MIELITGLPGNGKTLYTIGEVKKRAQAEGRQVYCAGFKELTLDWTVIDPLKWMDVPSGSIIVIDECQKIFRNRSVGSAPPVHVTELEEHRHKGLDIYLITQHPSLIDPAIRRLTQVHKHLIRIFGMEASTVHKWQSCIANPDLSSSRRDSEKVRWGFDKSLYGVYKSADVHTMRRSIPMRLKLLLLVPVVLALAAWFVARTLLPKTDTAPVDKVAAASAPGAQAPVGGAITDARLAAAPQPFDPVADAKAFVQASSPRVVGLDYTAPKYDHLTKPSRVPVPAGCLQRGRECKCISQQGTPLDVTYNMCLGFARNGFFQEFDPDGDARDSARTARSVAVMEGRPHMSTPVADAVGSQVVVMAEVQPQQAHMPLSGGLRN